MNILERAEKAAELKKNGVCNCAQAVASVLADQTDLSEEELMLSQEGRGTVRTAKQMSVQFVKKTGASLCKDLKGRDTKVVLSPCEDCVRNAVLIYGETVGLKE